MNRYTIKVKLGNIFAEEVYIGRKEVCDKTGYSRDTIDRWFRKNPNNMYQINGFTTIRRERNINDRQRDNSISQ